MLSSTAAFVALGRLGANQQTQTIRPTIAEESIVLHWRCLRISYSCWIGYPDRYSNFISSMTTMTSPAEAPAPRRSLAFAAFHFYPLPSRFLLLVRVNC